MSIDYADIVTFGDNVPCPNRGCIGHMTHPCEMCGRRMARGVAQVRMGFLTVSKERKVQDGESKNDEGQERNVQAEKVVRGGWFVQGKASKKVRVT